MTSTPLAAPPPDAPDASEGDDVAGGTTSSRNLPATARPRVVTMLEHVAEIPAPPVVPPPQGGIADLRAAVTKAVGFLSPGLGNVFLIPHPWVSLLLWVALACTPRLAAFGAIGLAVGLLGQRLLGVPFEKRVGGGLRANSIMAAVAAGWMTGATLYPLESQVLIAAATAASAFVITAAIMRVLRNSECPSLLWGYCLSAAALFALFPIGTEMASARLTWWHTPPVDAATWITAFFQAIGSLLLSPKVEVGAIAVLAVLLWSRAAFAAGIVGWIAGAAVALNLQGLGIPFYWLPASHNFFVAGMAIGAFLIVPGYATLPLAALAGAGAALVDAALQSTMPLLAYLPVAAALTIYGAVGTLALARDRRGFWRNRWLQTTPEEAWWNEALWSQRLGRKEPLVVVPVGGVVQIAQGFDGALSHTSGFRHALDFVRVPPADAGNMANGDPAIPGSIWGSPVTAPAAGVVERVHDGVADNPIGISNFAENWGNYVTIRLDQGNWALLAHFRQWSIAVQPGTRVEIGTYLGAAGNSGRSPVPHVHLQVQEGPEAGARTLPFRLANYLSAATADAPLLEWNASKVPTQNTFVSAAVADPAVYTLLTSLSPGVATWMVEQTGTVPRRFRIASQSTTEVRHVLDPLGRYRLESDDGTSLVLVLAPDAARVVEQNGPSALLNLLAHAAPSLPYAMTLDVTWSDVVPSLPTGPLRWLKLLAAPYRPTPFTYARSVCIGAPAGDGENLTVNTTLAPHRADLPLALSATFEKIRGPVRLEATFAEGSLRFTQISFAPGLPF